MAQIDRLLKDPDKHFTPRVAQVVQDLHKQDRDVAAADPGLHPQQADLRRHAQQAETLGLRQGEFVQATKNGLQRIHRPETAEEFTARVAKVAARKGLEKPLYFPSESIALEHHPDFSAHAVGRSRATATPKAYTGKLFREGREDTHPEVYLTGLQRSIKRKHNWNLVADTFDQNAFKGLTNMKMGEIRKELDRRGIDPNSVSLWNPGRYRDELRTAQETSAGRHGDAEIADDEFGVNHLQQAVASSAIKDPAAVPNHLHETSGWSVVPRDAFNEIDAGTKPSGKAGRSWDILRGKQSRLMLSPNPAWNTFQVLSNAGLGAAATTAKGGFLPVALARQARLYKRLSPEARSEVDALAGEGASIHGQQARMGATMTVGKRYRNLKASPVWDKRVAGKGPTVRNLNPLEAGFAVDRWQNAHFRRAVLMQSMKHEVGKLDAQGVEDIIKDPARAEDHAQFMNDWMGDYTTYTSRERKGIARGPMFYGFLRHSLNLVFKTIPRDHPILGSIIMELGQLQQDELEKLGVDNLPWAKGKYYYSQGGKLHEVDLSRANPAMNALTGVNSPSQLAGVGGPLMGALSDQAFHASGFKDKQWSVYGKAAPYGAKASYFNPARGRVLLEDLLGTVPAYRTAEKATMFGPQGDDSLLWSHRPIKHKDKELRRADLERIEEDRRAANIAQILMPLIPRQSRDPEIAKTYGIKRTKKKRKTSQSYTGLGGDIGGDVGGELGGGSLQ